MNRFIRSSLSPLSEVPSDLESVEPRSFTSAEQTSTPISTNGFSAIQARSLRKRSQSYVALERKSKRPRTSLI